MAANREKGQGTAAKAKGQQGRARDSKIQEKKGWEKTERWFGHGSV